MSNVEIEGQKVEKELRKAFENTTIRNVTAIQNYTKETRLIVRDLEKQVKALSNEVGTLKKLFEQHKIQLSVLQQRFYQKGTVSYNDNNDG